MVIEILTSVVDNDNYKLNVVYLLRKLKKTVITKQGKNHLHTKKFDYNKARIYDFTRTARTDIRDDAVDSLCKEGALPGVQEEDQELIKEIFNGFFNYLTYKRQLKEVGRDVSESMSMLIFKDCKGEKDQPGYVAHVTFLVKSCRTSDEKFTVDVTLSCQRVTYFEVQKIDLSAFNKGIKDLHS